MGLVGGTADRSGFHLKGQVERAQHAHRLGDDLGANAITRQDCDVHEGSIEWK